MHKKIIRKTAAGGYGSCLFPMPTLTGFTCFDLNKNQRRIDLKKNKQQFQRNIYNFLNIKIS